MNADDFGLTGGVNRAIRELNTAGLLTSCTLMARALATDEAIGIAQTMPQLGVGCHVLLVDGEPVLPAEQIPTLAGPAPANSNTAGLRRTLGAFLKPLLLGRTDPDEIEAEATAQIRRLQAQGITLTHIDTHKHTHMFPAVLRPVLRAARKAGIRAVRNPFEPGWSLRATKAAPWIRRTEVELLRLLEPAFRRIITEEGFATTDGAIGVLATGTLDAATVTSLLQAMPEGTWELVTHPGYNDADLGRAGTRLLASRETERDALQALKGFAEVELISFAGLNEAG